MLGVVVAEFFGSEEGLGVMMVQAAGRYQVDVVFAGLIVFAALSLVMTALVQLLENRLEPLAAAAARRELTQPRLSSAQKRGPMTQRSTWLDRSREGRESMVQLACVAQWVPACAGTTSR